MAGTITERVVCGDELIEARLPERTRVLREVNEGIARFRTGDVIRVPAQAQLAWGVA